MRARVSTSTFRNTSIVHTQIYLCSSRQLMKKWKSPHSRLRAVRNRSCGKTKVAEAVKQKEVCVRDFKMGTITMEQFIHVIEKKDASHCAVDFYLQLLWTMIFTVQTKKIKTRNIFNAVNFYLQLLWTMIFTVQAKKIKTRNIRWDGLKPVIMQRGNVSVANNIDIAHKSSNAKST